MAKTYEKKSDADLTKLLGEKRGQLRTLRFGEAGSKSRDVKETANTKKEIARILTEMGERQLNVKVTK